MRRHALLLVLLALAAPGCGGGKEDAFRDDYRPLNSDLIDIGDRTGDAIQTASGKSNAEIAKEFGRLARDLDALNVRLKDLDPPGDLRDELKALTDGVQDAVGSLEDVEAAATEGDAAKARNATARFVAISREVNEAQNKLADETGAEKGAA